MRLVETFISNPDRWDCRQGPWELEIINEDGKVEKSISFIEDEPEDMTFGRSLSDVFVISDLVRVAYEAGKRGEELHYEYIKKEEEE